MSTSPPKSDFDWDSVHSVADLNKNVIRFLKGTLPHSPWHRAPINFETIPIRDALIRLNKMGFTTVESQPGTFIFPVKNYKTKELVKPNRRDPSILLAEIQHGYISGIINKNKIPKIVSKIIKDPSVCMLTFEYSTAYYSQLNVPSSSDYINGNFYNLTTNAETIDGKDILKMKGFTTHDLTNIRTYADEILEAIEDEDLLQDIAENCSFIMFIHNLVGSLDSPDAGLGLENKVISFLSSPHSSSASVTRKIRSI